MINVPEKHPTKWCPLTITEILFSLSFEDIVMDKQYFLPPYTHKEIMKIHKIMSILGNYVVKNACDWSPPIPGPILI